MLIKMLLLFSLKVNMSGNRIQQQSKSGTEKHYVLLKKANWFSLFYIKTSDKHPTSNSSKPIR